MKTFKTKMGTELPLLNLKGKDYLQAQHRAVWFREEKPEWSVETEIVSHSPDHSLVRATIKNETGRIMAQASKEETKQGFADHLEKAETGAISRALALCGFGTAFAQEFEEGERLADSPLPEKKIEKNPDLKDPGKYIFSFGKHKGMTLEALGPHDCDSYARYIQQAAAKEGKPVTGKVAEALDAIAQFLKTREVKSGG